MTEFTQTTRQWDIAQRRLLHAGLFDLANQIRRATAGLSRDAESPPITLAFAGNDADLVSIAINDQELPTP